MKHRLPSLQTGWCRFSKGIRPNATAKFTALCLESVVIFLEKSTFPNRNIGFANCLVRKWNTMDEYAPKFSNSPCLEIFEKVFQFRVIFFFAEQLHIRRCVVLIIGRVHATRSPICNTTALNSNRNTEYTLIWATKG